MIAPAIQKLVASGKQAYGPYSASDFFGTEKYHSFDAVLAMYHDQGVAPLKALAATENIVYVAGLLVPCAASCYGPSFDIAGHNEADADPFRQALYAVIDAARNRKNYDAPLANPLPKLYHEKRDESEKVRFAIPKKREGRENEKDVQQEQPQAEE